LCGDMRQGCRGVGVGKAPSTEHLFVFGMDPCRGKTAKTHLSQVVFVLDMCFSW